ncbi:MAG: hypothetical protein HF981_16725 [Desulfobacteraceae bacterium]|nr:hypothetical protein [Desulfobacteraceae bacterium]MBC2752035.1 hypothetical protein [Desulfobacteraceae bacterium]
MSCSLTLYKPSEFIRKTATGHMDLERSLEAVHELAQVAGFHRDSHILIDVRETESTATHLEQMRLALEFGNYRHLFHNKIALLIPETSDRIEKANLMKRCMEAEGFEMKVFVSFEHAIEWFSEVVPLDPPH